MTSPVPTDPAPAQGHGRRLALSFQARVSIILLATAVVPLVAFGILLIVGGAVEPQIGARLLLFVLAIAVIAVLIAGSAVALDLIAPLREMSDSVARVSAGDMSQPIPVRGNDALAQLAESHNRLAADAERRTRQLGQILDAVEAARPGLGVETLARQAARDAEAAFGLISAELRFVDPDTVPPDERIPGVSVPVRAELRAGDERMGLLVGRLPATRTWARADQSLLDLYASEIAVAIRNAQLFAQVGSQNAQLRTLAEAKDDFLRGVSHNLQTPLTRIRSNAEALAASPRPGAASQDAPNAASIPGRATSAADAGTDPDARLVTIIDQADRLSRMVQQLLLVSRLDSQPLRPKADVLAIAPRVQRAWDALAVADRSFELDDRARGWLAVADGDQLDQVLWALLDNAVKYGEGTVLVRVGAEPGTRTIWTTITDGGRGLDEADRAWLFGRFARGAAGQASGNGSGLGLYVSRALMQSMGGDLVLDPAIPGSGATFRLTLPGEPASEA
jgi:signal transduction histidine kinase/HAMP domain-containing protein